MKITKILNNNAVVVTDGNEEKIAIGAGVAFQKSRNDIVNPQKIEKLFVLKENEKLGQLLSRIPGEHVIISEQIISYAEEFLGTQLNEHIHIVLTDHISFAIERERDGIHIKNKLLQEIKILYSKEYEVGIWAIGHIKKALNIEMPVDEAAFIALHIHTMKLKGGDLRQTVRQTTIIRDMVHRIMEFMNIKVNEDDLSYQRLITHLRFALTRVNQYEHHTMDREMQEMIIKKFHHSHQCTLSVAKDLAEMHGVELPDHELAFITLHIERLRKH